MNDFVAHIYVRRSTSSAGDGSLISPRVPFRASFFYNGFIEKRLAQMFRDYENEMRRSKGAAYVSEHLADGLFMFARIEDGFARFVSRILGLGDSVSVCAVKIRPDTLCDDPRARNPEFAMNIVFYHAVNERAPAFKRFARHCLDMAFKKNKPGVYDDLSIEVPGTVFGLDG